MGEAPLARSTDLIVEELGDEVLIYDTTIDRGHSLSPEAAKVWRACNGMTPVEELSSRLGLDQETVDCALDELANCDLLTAATQSKPGSTRRQMTLKMAKVGAAAAAVPLIVSVAAPLPAQAASLAFCLNLGGGVGNCGNACCQGGSGCGCCHKGGDFSNRACVNTDAQGSNANCVAFFNTPGSNFSCQG